MTSGNGRHYDRAVKAEALALVELGETAQRAAERLNINPRNVQRWVKRSREVSAEVEHPAVMNDWYRLTRRTQSRLHDGLDAIVDDDTALKHLTQLTVLAGVGTDKIFRDREPKYGLSLKATGPIVIVTNAQAPVIEGECTDVTEPDQPLAPLTGGE